VKAEPDFLRDQMAAFPPVHTFLNIQVMREEFMKKAVFPCLAFPDLLPRPRSV